MRPTLVLALSAVFAALVLPSCREAPPQPVVVIPATGWTADDTSASTTELSGALTAHPWVNQFRETKGRSPVIEVRLPEDRSGDQVPVDAVAAAFQQVLGASDRVLVAGQGQVADVALVTIIGLRRQGDQAWFTVDARVLEGVTGDALCTPGIQRVRNEPVPVAAPAPR